MIGLGCRFVRVILLFRHLLMNIDIMQVSAICMYDHYARMSAINKLSSEYQIDGLYVDALSVRT